MFRSKIPPQKRQKRRPKKSEIVPVRDPDLGYLSSVFLVGKFYQLEKTPRLRLYRKTEERGAARSFSKLVLTGDLMLFAGVDSHPYIKNLFRFFVIHGENIGYVVLKKDQAIECLKLVDIETVRS